MALRIVFMGTPDFSVPVLKAILADGHHVVAVYSQPPRPAGRGMAETKSPVQQFAEAQGLPVLTPLNFKSGDARAQFSAHAADAAIVVAYGLILPETVLKAPRFGCFNVHASLLPRWRGAAPIQRAIMAGDAKTGVMIMAMDTGLDTGPVCLVRELPIVPGVTASELHDQLSGLGAEAASAALASLERGTLIATPQSSEGVNYAAKIDKAEARIDFARPAPAVANHICGLSPFPGAWFEVAIGTPLKLERIKVLRARAVSGSGEPGTVLDTHLTIACGEGAVRLEEVQRAGKRPVPAQEFLRGLTLPPGTRLGSARQN